MKDQNEHIEILKELATLDPGNFMMGKGSYQVKISANDIINAGIRLEELNIFNFKNNDADKKAEHILKLRDSIIDIHYRHFNKPDNILIFKGSSRSGKTNNIIRSAILKNLTQKFDLNIIAPSFKMLNLGSFIDAKDFIEQNDIDVKVPASASGQFKFKTGGTITFEVVTSENEAKRNRKNVYINEGDGIPKEIASLIIGRAGGQKFIDFNPTKKFWVDDYQTETNLLSSTWCDNPFLSVGQLQWFEHLEKVGKNAEIGSPERYAYEVYYLGNYSILSGKAYELSDFDIRDEVPEKFDYYVSYSDPSLGVGADFFASLLFGIKNKEVWVIDCIFSQFVKPGGFIEQLKKWDAKYNNKIDHYAEKNGTSGVVTKAVKEMYDGILTEVPNSDNKAADIIVYSTTAKSFKFKKTAKMIEFINQCVDFPNAEHDDAPDCLARGTKILLKYFDL
jgi:predicted phage terminase large subunit-like protein